MKKKQNRKIVMFYGMQTLVYHLNQNTHTHTHTHTYIYIYIYIYIGVVKWLPTKLSLVDDSGFKHGFGAEASLPLPQSVLAVTQNTTTFWWINVIQWDCYIPVDAVKALSWNFFFMIFLLSVGESPRLTKNTVAELVMKPRYPTLIGNTLVI